MSVPSFADFVAAYAGELGIRLEPYQLRLLEDLASGDPGRPRLFGPEVRLEQRRAHRRWVAAISLAAAAIGGEDVHVLTTDAAQARDLYASAVREVERYAAAVSAPANADAAASAIERLERAAARLST